MKKKVIKGFKGLMRPEGLEAHQIPDDYLYDIENMEILLNGDLVRRRGLTEILEANGVEQGWLGYNTLDNPRGIKARYKIIRNGQNWELDTGVSSIFFIADTENRRVREVKANWTGAVYNFEIRASKGLYEKPYALDYVDVPISWRNGLLFVVLGDDNGYGYHWDYPYYNLQFAPPFADSSGLKTLTQLFFHSDTNAYSDKVIWGAMYEIIGGGYANGGIILRSPRYRTVEDNLPDPRHFIWIPDFYYTNGGKPTGWLIAVTDADEIRIYEVVLNGDVPSITLKDTILVSGISVDITYIASNRRYLNGAVRDFDLYIADNKNSSIYKINVQVSNTGAITVGTQSTYATLTNVYAIDIDPVTGDLYAVPNDSGTDVYLYDGSDWYSESLDVTYPCGPYIFIEKIKGEIIYGDKQAIYRKNEDGDAKSWERIYESLQEVSKVDTVKTHRGLVIARDGVEHIKEYSPERGIENLSIQDVPIAGSSGDDYAGCYVVYKNKNPLELWKQGKWVFSGINSWSAPSDFSGQPNGFLVAQKDAGTGEYNLIELRSVDAETGAIGWVIQSLSGQISINGELPNNDPAPQARYVEVYRGRMIIANTDENPNRWWWSDTGLLPRFDNFNLEYWFDEMPDEIRGLKTIRDVLLIFTKREIWRVYGTLPFFGNNGNWKKELLSDDVGLLDSRTLIQVEGYIYFLGTDKRIWRTDGFRVEPISIAIDDLMKDLEPKGIAVAYGDFKYILTIINVNATEIDQWGEFCEADSVLYRTFVYDFRLKAWTKHTIPFSALFYDSASNTWLAGWCNPCVGNLWQIVKVFDGDLDMGNSFTGSIKTKAYDMDYSGLKRFTGIKIVYDYNDDYDSPTNDFIVNVIYDGASHKNYYWKAGQRNKVLSLDNFIAHTIQLELTNIVRGVIIKAIEIYFDYIEERRYKET